MRLRKNDEIKISGYEKFPTPKALFFVAKPDRSEMLIPIFIGMAEAGARPKTAIKSEPLISKKSTNSLLIYRKTKNNHFKPKIAEYLEKLNL